MPYRAAVKARLVFRAEGHETNPIEPQRLTQASAQLGCSKRRNCRTTGRIALRLAASLALLLGICGISSEPACAQGQQSRPEMTLRTIMQELGTEFLRLTNSLLIDDFNGVEDAAKVIQGHPLPDEIVAAIK